ncbi:hypothetical protein BH09PSE4_BH09PSE4_16360 [soil metagenome]
MVILVMGQIKLAAGQGAQAAQLFADHQLKVRAEEGCEHYAFALDVADPDLVHVAERWASAEAIAAHGQQDHQKAFGRALMAQGVEKISVKAWDGEFWRTLIGE